METHEELLALISPVTQEVLGLFASENPDDNDLSAKALENLLYTPCQMMQDSQSSKLCCRLHLNDAFQAFQLEMRRLTQGDMDSATVQMIIEAMIGCGAEGQDDVRMVLDIARLLGIDEQWVDAGILDEAQASFRPTGRSNIVAPICVARGKLSPE
tara:strand:+ start:191 stop:658 length:468 start_codon:yes stop_codon:yes gene_type:complete